MKKNILSKLHFLIFFTFCSTVIFSQTIINYQTWTGASGCNIFASSTNVPATINGSNGNIAHLTAIGQPTYDNVNKSVNLVSQIVNSFNHGTEYRTTINFKAGYSYKITINASRIMSQQTGANVLLRLDLNSGGSGNNTQCNGTGIIDASGSGNLKQSLPITSSSFADYIFNYVSLSSQQSYLMVAAIPPAGSVYQTILIRKITIEETPPTPTFTLSPSTSTISCGSTTPQTFTVTNLHNTPNVTNHTWNLGATNGWLYNGNPAPQTISTGTTNTLALTPSCSGIKKNISVTVTAGGSNYQTNTSAITNSSPSLSISGSNAFCSGTSSYSISNIPCNATVSWSSSNTGIATITPTGNPATLTKVGNGNVNITATINGVGCLTNNILSKAVAVGVPQAGNIIIWNSLSTTTIGHPVGFVAGYPPSNRCQIMATEWQVFSMGANILNGDFECPSENGTSKNIFFQQTGTAYVQARIQNTCGWSNWSVAVPIQVNSGYFFMISPNPANTTITVKQRNKTEEDISEIRIFDNTGNLKKQFKYGRGTKQTHLNISNLKDGIYFIEISGNKNKDKQQLVIQR